MPFKYQTMDSKKKIELTTDIELLSDDVDLLNFIRSLGDLERHIAVEELRFDFTPPITGEYTITLSDGRIWVQRLIFDNPVDLQMSFTTMNNWRLSEFAIQHPIQNILISLRNHSQLTKARIKW